MSPAFKRLRRVGAVSLVSMGGIRFLLRLRLSAPWALGSSVMSESARVMSLTAGTRLGSYEVLSPLGAGGMGEVFCARDTSLGREVAIKVLPDAFSADPERVARFEREARVLASLNHSSIGAIYGLERAGAVTFLVLELVPGETMADRLRVAHLVERSTAHRETDCRCTRRRAQKEESIAI